jgi:hypothetical protein
VASEERITRDKKRAGLVLGKGRKGHVEIILAAGV